MKRIYYHDRIEETVTVTDDYLHYLKNVVRAREGEKVGVLTPEEFAECELVSADKKSAVLKTLNVRKAKDHGHSLKVYQCLLKREYMDFAVEKYAELGVTEIVPVISERSLSELKDKTRQRFTDIATRAVLQSENEKLPLISEAVSIDKIFADKDRNIIFYERYKGNGIITPAKSMSIVIGPEGGFTDDEYSMLAEKSFIPMKPIGQIMKAETAAVVFAGHIRILQETM